MTMQRKLAGWLLLIAVVGLIVGVALWTRESKRVSNENAFRDGAAAFVGNDPQPAAEADHTAESVLVGFSAVAGIVGVMLLAGTTPRRGSPSASEGHASTDDESRLGAIGGGGQTRR